MKINSELYPRLVSLWNMETNPIRNAFLAELYIIGVVTIIFNGSKIFGEEDNILIPIAMLSLLVLSVLVMFSLFLLTPARLYLEDKKAEALKYLFTTTSVFAGLMICVLIIAFIFT